MQPIHTLLLAVWVSNTSAAALSGYNADPSSVSVSGLSAGGFMAAQLGVAYSKTFNIGFGVFAGGPFDCARNQAYSRCMNNNNPSITTPIANMRTWSGNQIDSIDNLKSRKVYLQVGSSDTTVGPNPMNALQSQLSNFVTAANVKYDTRTGQAHTFPTDFDSTGNNACGSTASPYISNCAFDGAGAVLTQMYGALTARNTGTLTGSVVSFDQTGVYGAEGMGATGYLYIPRACASGSTRCKVHVALHGCLQSYGQIGSKFIDNTGYNKWADTNNIIVLYPQAKVDYTARVTPGSGSVPNPNACLDWIGWYGNDFDQRGGQQMAAIVAQVSKITSSGTGTTPTNPSSTFLTSTTSSAGPKPSATVTCAYAGQYVRCPSSGFYQYCYYIGQQYTC